MQRRQAVVVALHEVYRRCTRFLWSSLCRQKLPGCYRHAREDWTHKHLYFDDFERLEHGAIIPLAFEGLHFQADQVADDRLLTILELG